MFAYPASAGPAELRGRYIGAAHAMFGVGSAIGPAVGVALWTVLGSSFWVWCSALSLLALAAAVRGVRPKAKVEPVPTVAGETVDETAGAPETPVAVEKGQSA
jgi:MFS family permease